MILLDGDSRSAREQIDDRYGHGGGFRSSPGTWQLILGAPGEALLTYVGDPPFRELSRSSLPHSKELLVLFEHDFLVIFQGSDLSFDVCRVD